MAARVHPWYVAFTPRPEARLRLYCFPCAGGGPSMYRAWPAALPDWIEVRAVSLPARQGRHREPALTDADTAIKALFDGLVDEFDRDEGAPLGAGLADGAAPGPDGAGAGSGGPSAYAFFGHSMGALLAFRLARELVDSGRRGPRLLAAASWPPQGSPGSMPDPSGDDADFAAAALGLGGVPAELAEDTEMLNLMLPLLRADFELCFSYAYRPAGPLPLPVLALGGAEDPVVPPAMLASWEPESVDYLGLHLFPGEHFFLNDRLPELAALVTDALAGRLGPAD